MLVTSKYRILTSRPGESPTTYAEKSFTRESQAGCDAEAKNYLKEIAANQANAWDDLFLERIDVEEKTTPIAKNIPEDHQPGAKRIMKVY